LLIERPFVVDGAVVRASITVNCVDDARRVGDELCAKLTKWGTSVVLLLRPDDRWNDVFAMDIELRGGVDVHRVETLTEIAHALASGAWKTYDENRDDAFMAWDERDGGHASVAGLSWLCLELQ